MNELPEPVRLMADAIGRVPVARGEESVTRQDLSVESGTTYFFACRSKAEQRRLSSIFQRIRTAYYDSGLGVVACRITSAAPVVPERGVEITVFVPDNDLLWRPDSVIPEDFYAM